MITDNVTTVIDTLRNFELTMALLYDTYAGKFRSGRHRWLSLAEAKRMHARWLGELKAYHRYEIVSFYETRIIIQTINQSIEYLHDQIDRARSSKNMGLREAVLIALRMENTILDNSFLRIFSLHTPRAKAARSRLHQDARLHREKLILWMEQLEKNEKMVA